MKKKKKIVCKNVCFAVIELKEHKRDKRMQCDGNRDIEKLKKSKRSRGKKANETAFFKFLTLNPNHTN